MTTIIRPSGRHRVTRARYTPPLPLFVAFWAVVDGAAGFVAAWVWLQVAAQ